jgi:hypothetical protein
MNLTFSIFPFLKYNRFWEIKVLDFFGSLEKFKEKYKIFLIFEFELWRVYFFQYIYPS